MLRRVVDLAHFVRRRLLSGARRLLSGVVLF